MQVLIEYDFLMMVIDENEISDETIDQITNVDRVLMRFIKDFHADYEGHYTDKVTAGEFKYKQMEIDYDIEIEDKDTFIKNVSMFYNWLNNIVGFINASPHIELYFRDSFVDEFEENVSDTNALNFMLNTMITIQEFRQIIDIVDKNKDEQNENGE
ncbi:MAG: hypothetical protein JKY49_07590 [Cohaesibacteraceae bacterium]|nr:hypothetical protein [Cohaesibacteraceae bacterium]MBL4875325.1 hypothetical protein [Cohaesibacteraceae bacterium]